MNAHHPVTVLLEMCTAVVTGAGRDCAGKCILAIKYFAFEGTHTTSAYLGMEV